MLRFFTVAIAVILVVAAGLGAGALYVLYAYGRDLPDYRQLAVYEPPVMTRVHAGDGQLVAEFARERRMFVPVGAVPDIVVNAFLSAEDQNFYSHSGVDVRGVLRAVVTNVQSLGSDRRPVGGSTITQQVAKNFLLTNEVSFERKIREAILAFRIERALGKDRILELYLNEIYLGEGSYGVASAALNYFNKSLEELTLSEAAFLAALPKAPSNYHPVYRPEAALGRRNWVIGRMLEDGHITAEQAAEATATPIAVDLGRDTEFVEADYYAEEVRRELYDIYGEDTLYEGGLSVRGTLDPDLQEIARGALRDGLIAYDRRHGWRGPLRSIAGSDDFRTSLEAVEVEGLLPNWVIAAVASVDDTQATILLASGAVGTVPLSEVTWAREWRTGQYVGSTVSSVSSVLDVGDVVAVERIGEIDAGEPLYRLRQIPDANGALVAMDPHTGRVLAMVGGFNFELSEFNRATQALRQPGSAFKPFVYAAALDAGFTPSSFVLDAPFVIDQGAGLGTWKPANYTQRFYGPSTLRLGLEKSRNLMTVRLAQYIGMDRIVDYAGRFGVMEDMQPTLAMALGAGETSLLRLTAAYSMLVNGGNRITPTLIDRIQDRRGRTVFRHDVRECGECFQQSWYGQPEPVLADDRERVLDASTSYQIVSMLQGVVERGTGVGARIAGMPIAGKTGTSNDAMDTWFVGFTPDLAVGVFVGFDQPRSLGNGEQGATIPGPVFRRFMEQALVGEPAIPFRVPPDIRLVRVNAITGLPAQPGDRDVILEAFRPGTEPSTERWVLDGSEPVLETTASPRGGTGGLY